ncbi:Virulence factor, hemolysin regulator [Ferrimonas balearica DSM 9799]|uniref:Virulence factor, hemolysin regulator n=2 Tax=Ferrimonas balearica TaxID=44012 RepID=E1SSC2_FERBD|nr:Virulence factor, hemolysin regulator [Ferrimonas balearica DSM 9799]
METDWIGMLWRNRMRVWRFVQVGAALVLMAAILQLWLSSERQSQALLARQTDQLADSLVQQAAHAAATALKLDDAEQLNWLINSLVDDPRVVSATVFSHQGQRLAFSQSLFPEAQLPDEETLQAALARFAPLTATVRQEDEVLGYLRIRINRALFFRDNRTLHQQQHDQQQLMLLLAGLVGALLARSLSFKRASYSYRQAQRRNLVKARRRALKRRQKDDSANEPSSPSP